MTDYTELWPGGPRYAQAEHFRLGTDSVLLADFVSLPGASRGIDLGCGGGILTLLLLSRSERLRMTGLEILPDAAERAEENLRANGLETRGSIVCGDIRKARSLFQAGSFDLAVANPPFFPLGSGALPPDPARAAARGELNCTLEDLCSAASFLCRTGGRFFLVHRPERLSEIFVTMSAHGLEPKRMRFVCAREGASPSLVLIEGRRGGACGLAVDPALLLENARGEESDELKRIYHR
jgi:tRNA1Val (adenine37-N6)-methyltransferase